jgi:UDP-glucose 4-epimerase
LSPAHPAAILVTGGAGYIGAHCCKALSEAGYLPVCFDNLSTGHRDFVKWGPLAIGDVADRNAVNALLKGSAGGSYNLGTGSGYSVRQVLTAIEHETGRELPPAVGARRAGDPSILVANPSAAKRDFGFFPGCSDSATIVKSAWQWHQKAHPKRMPSNAEHCRAAISAVRCAAQQADHASKIRADGKRGNLLSNMSAA